MDVSAEVSYRFRFVSCWSMIAVVFIHAKFIMSRWSGFMDISSTAGKWSDIVQFSISEVLCRLAVPLFFVISGFFMAYHNDGSIGTYKNRVLSRVKSLFIPYLLFSSMWLVLTFILGKIDSPDVLSLLNMMFLQPVPFQFWFLQHLMILVLCSWALYHVALRYMNIVLPLLVCVYIVYPDIRGGGWSSLLFYFAGICLAIRQMEFNRERIRLFATLYVVAAVVCIAMRYLQLDGGTLYFVLHKSTTLLGVYAVINWIFAGKAHGSRMVVSPRSCFWVFALHEPLQSMLKNIYLSFADSQIAILVGYFMIPAATIMICIIVSESIYRFMPRTANIMAGGR